MLSQRREKIAMPLRPLSEVYIGTATALSKRLSKGVLTRWAVCPISLSPGRAFL